MGGNHRADIRLIGVISTVLTSVTVINAAFSLHPSNTVLTLKQNSACRVHRAGLISSLKYLYVFKGIKYLYLTPQDYTRISSLNSVHCKHVEEDGESR